jgi:membrane protein YdbS with pleckstrin-like domain
MKKFVSISAGILIAIILFLVLVYYINIETYISKFTHFFIYLVYIIYSVSCGYAIYLYSKSTYDEYEENIDLNND